MENSLKHSPSPWFASLTGLVLDKNGDVVAMCGNTTIKNSMGGQTHRHHEEEAANTKLIARAPDLLKMLERILNDIEDVGSYNGGISDATRSEALKLINQLNQTQK